MPNARILLLFGLGCVTSSPFTCFLEASQKLVIDRVFWSRVCQKLVLHRAVQPYTKSSYFIVCFGLRYAKCWYFINFIMLFGHGMPKVRILPCVLAPGVPKARILWSFVCLGVPQARILSCLVASGTPSARILLCVLVSGAPTTRI